MIDLDENPEVRLAFMARALGEQEWSAVVRAPAEDKAARKTLHALKNTLNGEDYATQIKVGKDGFAKLHITHFGERSTFNAVRQGVGIVGAIRHTFTHLGAQLSRPSEALTKLGQSWSANKARLIGFSYILSDMVMFASGFHGTTERKMRQQKRREEESKNTSHHSSQSFRDRARALVNPKDGDFLHTNNLPNVFRSLYGLFGTLQSLVFMNYALEADKQIERDLKRRIDVAEKKKLNLSDTNQWINISPKVNRLKRFLEKNTIVFGSALQIVGRLFWSGAGVMEYRKAQHGINRAETEIAKAEKLLVDTLNTSGSDEFSLTRSAQIKDFTTRHITHETEKIHRNQLGLASGKDKLIDGSLSIVGWLLFMLPEQPAHGKQDGALMRLIRPYSNRLSSLLNTVASGYGIKSSLPKAKAKIILDETEAKRLQDKIYSDSDKIINQLESLPPPTDTAASQKAHKDALLERTEEILTLALTGGTELESHLREESKSYMKAHAKRRTAQYELAGNLGYLAGDSLIFLTKSADYDAKFATHSTVLAKVGANTLKHIPIAMGKEKKNAAIEGLAKHLAREADITLAGKKPARLNAEEKAQQEQRIATLAHEIRSKIINLLPDQTHLLEEVTAVAASVIGRCPQHSQAQITKRMAAMLTQMQNVDAPEAETVALIKEYLERKHLPSIKGGMKLSQIQEELDALIDIIPGTDKAAITSALYDVVKPAWITIDQKKEEISHSSSAGLSLQRSDKPASIVKETTDAPQRRWQDIFNTSPEPALAF